MRSKSHLLPTHRAFQLAHYVVLFLLVLHIAEALSAKPMEALELHRGQHERPAEHASRINFTHYALLSLLNGFALELFD